MHVEDNVIHQNIQGICEIACISIFISIDIKDIRAAMEHKSKAFADTGKAGGDNRARQAFDHALKSPLLSDIDIKSANAVLLNISANENYLLIDEVTELQAFDMSMQAKMY